MRVALKIELDIEADELAPEVREAIWLGAHELLEVQIGQIHHVVTDDAELISIQGAS
jgi:hypothetical protein